MKCKSCGVTDWHHAARVAFFTCFIITDDGPVCSECMRMLWALIEKGVHS